MMGSATTISWTDATWNCIRGCSRVSAGCTNCYAEAVAKRFSGPGLAYEGLTNQHGRWNGVVRMVPEHLADPLRWKAPRRIFVNSMSDLFHENLPDDDIAVIFGVMLLAAQHTYQVLTKRADRMRDFFKRWSADACLDALVRFQLPNGQSIQGARPHNRPPRREWLDVEAWPVPWIWLGVSVENQDAANERVVPLLETPALIRFLSCEPLIGPVDLAAASPNARSLVEDLDWVIAGCESGHDARTCDVEWLRSLRDQCRAAHVPYFLKQAVDIIRLGQRSAITFGEGTRAKGSAGRASVLELPYLDGVQHAAFPEVR